MILEQSAYIDSQFFNKISNAEDTQVILNMLLDLDSMKNLQLNHILFLLEEMIERIFNGKKFLLKSDLFYS